MQKKAIDIQHLNIVLSQNNKMPLTEEQKETKRHYLTF